MTGPEVGIATKQTWECCLLAIPHYASLFARVRCTPYLHIHYFYLLAHALSSSKHLSYLASS